jgi:hypothetical protein
MPKPTLINLGHPTSSAKLGAMVDDREIEVRLLRMSAARRLVRLTHLPTGTSVEREAGPNDSIIAVKRTLVAQLEALLSA